MPISNVVIPLPISQLYILGDEILYMENFFSIACMRCMEVCHASVSTPRLSKLYRGPPPTAGRLLAMCCNGAVYTKLFLR